MQDELTRMQTQAHANKPQGAPIESSGFSEQLLGGGEQNTGG